MSQAETALRRLLTSPDGGAYDIVQRALGEILKTAANSLAGSVEPGHGTPWPENLFALQNIREWCNEALKIVKEMEGK